MYAKVALLNALRLLLLAHVRLMLIIHKVNNWDPRITVVDIVAKARCINHSELDFELFFLQFGLDDFDFDGLVELLLVATIIVLG